MLITDPPANITENLTMLGSTEYPLYLFRGEREAAIFEGGTGAMGPLVGEQFEQLGIEPRLVKQIVIPHAHPDHVMAVAALREMCPDAVVLASGPAAAVLSNEKAIGFFCKLDAAITAALAESGTIAEKHHPKPLAEMRIAVDRQIAQGDKVTVDWLSFDVLETPGHSDCSLSFHQPQQGILIISDAAPYLMPDCKSWWPCYFTGYAPYLTSMRTLAQLDAEILCLGHRAVVRGAEEIKAYFDETIAATERYHRQIIDEITGGESIRQLAERLGSEAFEKTGWLPLDFFQKNCNLLVKQSLKHEGME